MRERLEKFLVETSLEPGEMSEINRMLARDSQYATACQLETSQEDLPVMAVTALITDPVSLSDPSRSCPSHNLSRLSRIMIVIIFLIHLLTPTEI